MFTITALQIQKNNKERVNVFLDGEYAFAVTLNVAAQLRKGQQLSNAERDALIETDEHERAYQRAVHYLGPRPRSRAEVDRYLRGKEFTPAAISAAIDRLAAQQYLSDEEFAAFWLDNRTRFRPRSAAAIRYELRQKGVDADIIAATLESLDEDDAAWAAAASKLALWRALDKEQFARKLTAFLARRGFSYATSRRICQRAWQAIQDDSTL